MFLSIGLLSNFAGMRENPIRYHFGFIKNCGIIIRRNLKMRLTASKRSLGLANALKSLFLAKILSMLTFFKAYYLSTNGGGMVFLKL